MQSEPVRAALRAAQSDFTRFCPVCGKSPHDKCLCGIPYTRPSGPVDLAAVARNSRHTIGDWMGRSVSTVHCPMFHMYGATQVMSRRSTRAPLANVPHALHQRILQSRLAMANPAHSVIPFMYDPLGLSQSHQAATVTGALQGQTASVLAQETAGVGCTVAGQDSNVASSSGSNPPVSLLQDLAPEAPPLGSEDSNRVAVVEPALLPQFVLDGVSHGVSHDALDNCAATIDMCNNDGADPGDLRSAALPETPGMSVDGAIFNDFNLPLPTDETQALPLSSPIWNQEQQQLSLPSTLPAVAVRSRAPRPPLSSMPRAVTAWYTGVVMDHDHD